MMSDPLDKATASPPPVIGEGCLSRYDPEALSAQDGTEFSGAAELWRQLQASGSEDSTEQDESA